MTLYFITGSKGKLKEAKDIIPSIKQLDIDLPEIQDIDARKIIKEKLLSAFKHKKGEFIVEDTSLYLDCMNGLPGPLIKWFMQTIGNKGLYDLAYKLNNFSAEAKTIIGYAKNKNNIKFFEGTCKGKIVSPKGKKGFGWDPVFLPKGHKNSFAQMPQEEKNRISMRRKAFNKLKTFMAKL